MARSTVYLTVELMREITYRLTKSYFAEYNEPIPAFDQHNRALLDSALSLPRATYGRVELYPTIADKAAVMFYAIIKNHPFANGNKRIATTALLVFLYLNKQWIESEQAGMYNWAVKIAESDSNNREAVLNNFTNWLTHHLTKRNKAKGTGLFQRIRVSLSRLLPAFWRHRKRP